MRFRFLGRGCLLTAVAMFALVTSLGRDFAVAASQDATPAFEATPSFADPCDEVGLGATPEAQGDDVGTPVMPPTVVEFDQLFVDLMIAHHEGAIAMSQVALVHAEHQEVWTLAGEIIAAETREIALMRGWRAVWYGDAPVLSARETIAALDALARQSPGVGGIPGAMGMLAMADDVEHLCAAPPPFDLAFINEMIVHHQSAILMARSALDHAVHAEVTSLAETTIVDQQQEIDAMIAWQTTWYGGTPGLDEHHNH